LRNDWQFFAIWHLAPQISQVLAGNALFDPFSCLRRPAKGNPETGLPDWRSAGGDL
jgi:hypothetical protein